MEPSLGDQLLPDLAAQVPAHPHGLADAVPDRERRVGPLVGVLTLSVVIVLPLASTHWRRKNIDPVYLPNLVFLTATLWMLATIALEILGRSDLLFESLKQKPLPTMPATTDRVIITAGQCRSARTLLSWSVSKLARTASISECDLDNFELERRKPNPATRDAIRRALEAAGAVFLPEDDVRVRPCTVDGPLIAGKPKPSAPAVSPTAAPSIRRGALNSTRTAPARCARL